MNEEIVDNNVEEVEQVEEVNTETKVDANGSDEATLTLEDVKKLIQSENDKVRTEYSKKLKAKDVELEEVMKSKMTEQEKAEYEHGVLQDQLSEREQLLQEKEELFNRSQLELSTVDLLKEHSLPLDAKNFLVSTNIDTTTSNVIAFKEMFNNAVKEVVEGKISLTAKEHKDSVSTDSVTLEQFKTMDYSSLSKLHSENPELYKELKQLT